MYSYTKCFNEEEKLALLFVCIEAYLYIYKKNTFAYMN